MHQGRKQYLRPKKDIPHPFEKGISKAWAAPDLGRRERPMPFFELIALDAA